MVNYIRKALLTSLMALFILLIAGCGGGAGGGSGSSVNSTANTSPSVEVPDRPAQAETPIPTPTPTETPAQPAQVETPVPTSTPAPTPTSAPTPEWPAWNQVNDFTYQLQGVDLTAMGNSKFDLVVIDYSRDGTEAIRFTKEEIQALKNSPGGPKIVLAYMSIGEAETYRWYWNDLWDANNDGIPDSGAPSWLDRVNPDWAGNYKVKYWDPTWQANIFGSPNSYLDKIIDAGFDGVYMDIIDAYEYYGPEGASGMNRASAEQEMVDFVRAIAQYARVTKGKTTFGVFPQNGEALASHTEYVQVITGIGRESIWYVDNTPRTADDIAYVTENLDIFRQAGKLVLSIDYPTQQILINDYYSKAHVKGYVPYATVRMLDKLTINTGHEPD